MGGLIDKEKRLESKRLRKERRSIILEAARQSFMRFPFAEVTLESIDKVTGLRQGKAGLIFGSKEELFLELLSSEIGQWRDALEAGLARDLPNRDALVSELSASVLDRHELLRWLGQLHIVLAGSVEVGAVHVFMHGLHEALRKCGARLEAVSESIPQGEGSLRLVRFLIFAAAVAALSRPVGAFALAMMQSDASWSDLDLEAELLRVADQVV